MKIVDVHVWKIDQAAVDGLEEIIAVDVVGADIVTGEPEIFYNIADKNDSKYTKEDVVGATGSSLAGRVRSNVEPEQHDEVIYYNGIRTNKCDGLSHTYSTNVHRSGGRGHDEKWATGFIYDSFKPNSSTRGSVALDTGNFNYPTNIENYLQIIPMIKIKKLMSMEHFKTKTNFSKTYNDNRFLNITDISWRSICNVF